MDSLFVVVWLLSASFGNYGTVESKFEKKFKDRPAAELFMKKAPKQCKNFEITSEVFDGETKSYQHSISRSDSNTIYYNESVYRPNLFNYLFMGDTLRIDRGK